MRFYLFFSGEQQKTLIRQQTRESQSCISFGNHIMAIFVAKVSHCIGFFWGGILSEMSHALFADLAHDFNLENPQCQWNGKQIVGVQCKQIAVGISN